MSGFVRHALDAFSMLMAAHRDLLPLALGSGVMLATMALSFWSLAGTAAWIRAARRSEESMEGRFRDEIAGLRDSVTCLAAELEQARTAAASGYATPRAGMNLSKRSQVLRMHRRGETPDQIASSMDLPRQEVELLLKVHRIVMARN